MAHVEIKIALQDEVSCIIQTDTIVFDEWFRLLDSGATSPFNKRIRGANGAPRLAKMDIHSMDLFGTPTCWGQVKTTITYGLAEGIKSADSWYGLGDPAKTKGGILKGQFALSRDHMKEKGVKFKGKTEKWWYYYYYQKKGDCCACPGTTNNPMDIIHITGRQMVKPR